MTRQEEIKELLNDPVVIEQTIARMKEKHPEDDWTEEEYALLLGINAECEWRTRQDKKPVVIKATLDVELKSTDMSMDAWTGYSHLISELLTTHITGYYVSSVTIVK